MEKTNEIEELYFCKGCATEYAPSVNWQQYCSHECKIENGGHGADYTFTLNSGVIGAISELLVCVDLLKRGFEVHRSVTPNSADDLVAVKDGKPITIQVKTGHKGCSAGVTKHKSNYLAKAILEDNSVTYYPPLPF